MELGALGAGIYVGSEHSEHQVYRMCLNLALVVCFDFSGNTYETILRMRAREKADVLFCSSAPPTVALIALLSVFLWTTETFPHQRGSCSEEADAVRDAV